MATIHELKGTGVADVEGIECRRILCLKRPAWFLPSEESPAKSSARLGDKPASMMDVNLSGDKHQGGVSSREGSGHAARC